MNVLPVSPQLIRGEIERNVYFNDLDVLGFGAACVSCCPAQRDIVQGDLKDTYFHFAAEAVHRGRLACVSIDCSSGSADVLSISHAQRAQDDRPIPHGEGFCVSPASAEWLAHVKELVEFFVRDVGYQCVLLDGLGFRADLPGPSDPLAAVFAARYPELDYPRSRDESTEYLILQKEKSTVLRDFCSAVATHAKSVGAKHVGITMGPFVPLRSKDSECAEYPFCESTLLARLPEVDFVVSNLRPADVIKFGVNTGDEFSSSPLVFHTEIMAHASGQRIVARADVSDDTIAGSAYAVSPLDYVRDCLNASIAGAPCGVSTHWLGKPLAGQQPDETFACAVGCSSRLGKPTAPVAFVFSYSGTRHVAPHTYEDVFAAYWALASRMAVRERIPMLTFHAETLQKDIRDHPEVQVLVFDERFPLSPEQMSVIRSWWQGSKKRAAIALGTGEGYSADTSLPGPQPSGTAYPGILELIGLKSEEPYVLEFESAVDMLDVSRVRRAAFLGDDTVGRLNRVAGVRRVFGSRAHVLYEVDHVDGRIPVVAEWRDRTTLAVFCGFGLSRDTADLAVRAIQYALREVDAPGALLDSCTDGVIWSTNRHDYLVVSNISDQMGSAVVRPGRANLWDCAEEFMLPDGDPVLELKPHSSRVFRVVGRRSKFLDVVGCSCLRSLVDGAGRADIEIVAAKNTTFILKNSPKEIQVDGRPCTVSQEVVNGFYYLTLQQCLPGDRQVTLRW